MRILFALLAAFGVAGIVFGALTILRGATGPFAVPFTHENYGGPGSILAGLMLLATALYLLAAWPRRR